jgi:hypothetical protein
LYYTLQDGTGLKRSGEGSEDEPAEKKMRLDGDGLDEEGETIEDRVRHSPRSCASRYDEFAILRQCLEYVHKVLQR